MELNRFARASALALAFLLAAAPADAQRYQDSGGTVVPGVVPIAPGIGPIFTSAHPGVISGTFSATVLGFAPTPGAGGLAQLLFSDASSHNVALPSGSDFKIENASANIAYCVASTSGSTAATAVNQTVPAQSTRAFHGVNGGTTFTNIACISPSSTLSITIEGGTGLAMDSGGGGGSGSGSNASVGATAAAAPGSATYSGILVSGGNMVGASGSTWGSAPTGLNVLGVNADVLASALPAGAATSANQPTNAAQNSTTSGQTGTLMMAAVQTTPPTLTSGQSVPPSIDPATGGLRVLCVGASCSGGGGGGGSGGATPQTTAGGDINVSTAVTTQLVSASGSNLIYVTAYKLVAAGTTSVSFEYGTGSLCGTGTTVIDGPMSLTAQTGAAQGSGLGVVLPPVPAGNALCLVNSAAIQVGGSLTYTQTNATLSAFGGGGGATPFVSNGSNISKTSVATSTTNAALTGSPSTIVVNNNGTVPLLVKSVSSSGGTVTAATADLIVPANSTFSLGTNGNGFVAYMAVGSTGSVLITQGSGIFTGAGGGGGSSGSGAAADATISGPTGTISAANNFSTGCTVANWQNGRVTLTGTCTSGSILSWSGFSGWNSGVLECTGAGTQGTNQFEVDVMGATGGTVPRRVATFTGPSVSIPLNLAGETFVNVVADQWTSGAPTCTLRGTVNQSVPDDYAVAVQADLSAAISTATAGNSWNLPAIPGEAIYVTSWDLVSGGATTATWVYGTGTNCGTGTVALSGAYPLAAQAGVSKGNGAGMVFLVPPGNTLCVNDSAAVQLSGSVSYTYR